MGVIFVAGVHAVGKTTACAHASKTLGIVHYSASHLIRAEKVSAIPLHGKAVADVEGNQVLLIRSVERACSRHQGKMILDGHFTIAKPDGLIETVEIGVFKALALDGIVVYHDEPCAIAERLHQRDGCAGDSVAVSLHQDAELAHARSVATTLRVPIKFLRAFDSDGLVTMAKAWIR